MELTGKIYDIGKVVNATETFRRRSFVIEYRNPTDGPRWSQHAQLELTQADVLEIDKYAIGDEITVTFEVTGRKYNKLGEEKFFTSLHALKIEKVASEVFVPPPTSRQPSTDTPPPVFVSDVRMLNDDMGNPDYADNLPF